MQPRMVNRAHIYPQALQVLLLGHKIFKGYIERDMMEGRLVMVQLWSLGLDEGALGSLKKGEILCMPI